MNLGKIKQFDSLSKNFVGATDPDFLEHVPPAAKTNREIRLEKLLSEVMEKIDHETGQDILARIIAEGIPDKG